jgi:hypothetical protein
VCEEEADVDGDGKEMKSSREVMMVAVVNGIMVENERW